MVQWKIACIFFTIEDLVQLIQCCKYLCQTQEEMYRAYLMERMNLTDEYWLDLFHGQYGNHSMHDYDFKQVGERFVNVLNHQWKPTRYSWKTFSILFHLNFELDPALPINKNTTLQSGSNVIALRVPLKRLLGQHAKLLKNYSKEKASYSCLQAKLNHQYEDHILKLKHVQHILAKIPRGLCGIQSNLTKRKFIHEKSMSVKRLCGAFTKKVSVIRTLQLSLDRDTQVVDKKKRSIERQEVHLAQVEQSIQIIRKYKYAYIRSVHLDTTTP